MGDIKYMYTHVYINSDYKIKLFTDTRHMHVPPLRFNMILSGLIMSTHVMVGVVLTHPVHNGGWTKTHMIA